jgi:steroid 5-alpha reductase family enzyme
MTIALITLVLAFAMMTAAWVLSRRLNDVSIVDILWAPAFAVLAIVSALVTGVSLRGFILLVLVEIWAVRLGSHIYARWRRLGHEDYRYTEIRRKRGGNFAVTSLWWIFWMQAALLWVISWPLQAALVYRNPLNWLDGVGTALAIAGIAIEAVADMQLTRFRADPANRNRVLDTGIWAWSRHPNYFGDFTLWWGFFLLAIVAGGPWWLILSPIAMSALLIHYSGAGLMEDTITSRRPGYVDYVRRTSLFVPLPPKS